MDLYTLNENFLAKDVIDEYVSAIWTERYSDAGDVRLVTPATIRLLDRLKPGTYLGLRGSREVMELKSQVIENNLMTVTGRSLVTFLDERYVWAYNAFADTHVADYTDKTKVPGQFIADVVSKFAISPVNFAVYQALLGMQWTLETIPHLTLGAVDTTGTAQLLTAPIGPIFTAIQAVAATTNTGITLYVDSADPEEGYSLKFETYRGLDRTSGQTVNPLLQLSANMETLGDVKEIHSIDGYKNVVYVLYEGQISVHYEDPDHIPEGWQRRVLLVDAEGSPIPTGKYEPVWSGTDNRGTIYRTYVSPTDVAAFRTLTAKNALVNHNFIHALDGQTSPENDLVFGVDYGLGDLIELQSFTGAISKARVSEYIRSEDKQGERGYPTISLVQ